MPLDLTQLSQITEPLLAWYEKNARVLPWRENTDAYRVWVSEIMLQQTRVDTVIPYYERFLRRFPDVAALAAAPEQELLKMWEGLGYYSRVRNMQKAAQQICEKYNGIFPNEYEQLLSLPGIGAYTAGAVASIAWNKPYAAVDGNVLRVVTRLTADSREISNTKFKNEITAALQEIYPVDKCGIFTQSLMELGAVVCMPNGTPRCTECPLQSLCSACAAGTQPAYPVKKKKAQRRIEEKTVLLMIHAGRLALQKEPGADCLVACGNCRIFREKQIQRKFKSGLKSVESRTVGYKKAVRCATFSHISSGIWTVILSNVEKQPRIRILRG